MEFLLRPFMNVFENRGMPGEYFLIGLIVFVWMIRVPRYIIETKKVSWKVVEFTLVCILGIILCVLVINKRS
jgi:hypothetical protein